MRALPRVLALVGAASLAAGAGAAAQAEPAVAGILAWAHQSGTFDGVALVADRGRILFRGGFGMADRARGTANHPDLSYPIASLTKQFTAALILSLADRGVLDLGATLTRYLPAYRADVGARVTLGQLLAHTSGIPDLAERPDIMQVVQAPRTPAELVQEYCSEDPAFDPGTRWAYTNCGYIILGHVAEVVAGRPYADLIAGLTAGAGLRHTGVLPAGDLPPGFPRGYLPEAGELRPFPAIDWSNLHASGGMFSTVDDLFRWDRVLADTGAIGRGVRRALSDPGPGNYAAGWLVATVVPDSLETFLTAYRVPTRPAGVAGIRVAMHPGDFGGFRAMMTRLPDRDAVVILIDNADHRTLGRLSARIIRALDH